MKNTSGIKTFFEYLPESIKFYKLKNEKLPKIIFLLVVVISLIENFVEYNILNQIPSEEIENLYSAMLMQGNPSDIVLPSEHSVMLFLIVIGTALLVKLISNLLFSVYMYSYISEIKGRDTSLKDSFKGTFKHIGRLICYNIIFGVLIFIGLMFFIFPAIIVYIVFVFGFCYILDMKLSVTEAMTASNEITKGKKPQVIRVFFGFLLMFMLPIFYMFSEGSLEMACMYSFFGTIAKLILQRLITQIYMDLEYKKEQLLK